MKDKKREITYLFHPAIVALACTMAVLCLGAYWYRGSLEPDRKRLTFANRNTNTELNAQAAAFNEYTPDRLKTAEIKAKQLADIALDDKKLEAGLMIERPWNIMEVTTTEVGGDISRYRYRIKYMDSGISEWLNTIVPKLLNWDAERGPVGIESIIVRTRIRDGVSKFDNLEVIVTGIARKTQK
jgi:hypothetical protein